MYPPHSNVSVPTSQPSFVITQYCSQDNENQLKQTIESDKLHGDFCRSLNACEKQEYKGLSPPREIGNRRVGMIAIPGSHRSAPPSWIKFPPPSASAPRTCPRYGPKDQTKTSDGGISFGVCECANSSWQCARIMTFKSQAHERPRRGMALRYCLLYLTQLGTQNSGE